MTRDRPVVLGDGIAGLSLAWELARAGAAPLVLGGARRRTSEAAAGMLAPSPELALNPALGRLAVEGLRHYPAFIDELAAETGVDPGFRRSGILRLAYSDAEHEALREGVGTYEAAGIASRWLDPRRCAEEVPGLGADGLRGGLLSYDEAQVLPAGLLAALAAAVVNRGGEVRRAEVTALAADGAGVRVELAAEAAVEADVVAVALGSWTARLPGLEGSVSPVRGQLLVFPAGPGPSRILYWGHNYVLTKADGTVVVGATMEPEAGFADTPDASAEGLRGLLPRVWPGLAGAAAEARAGLRPRAADGLPLVGWAPRLPGVFLFTGHFRNGFLLAPHGARLAAGEILGGPAAPLLEAMRPARLPR